MNKKQTFRAEFNRPLFLFASNFLGNESVMERYKGGFYDFDFFIYEMISHKDSDLIEIFHFDEYSSELYLLVSFSPKQLNSSGDLFDDYEEIIYNVAQKEGLIV